MRQSKNEKQENASGDDTAELNPQSKFKEKIIVLKNIGVLRLLIAAGSKTPKSANYAQKSPKDDQKVGQT